MTRGGEIKRLALGGLGLAYGLSGAVFGLARAPDRLSRTSLLLTVFALATGTCYLLVLLRRSPRLGPALLIAAAVGGAATSAVEPYAGLGFAFTLPWLAVFSVSQRSVVVIGLIDAAGIALVSTMSSPTVGESMGITFGILFTFAFAIAIQQLSVVRERTEAAAQARASEAVLAERQRLAREVHDVLAHSLSAQILHLEGARMLLERGDAPKALEHVRRAGRLARAGLVETKQALQALRGDDGTVVAQLETLAGEFRSATGAGCELSASADPTALAPEARFAIVRTAQEALTNVRKHAPGAGCAIRMRCADGWCELDVYNAGTAGGATGAEGGYGLIGMRERAELIGGSLTAGPEPGGFRVVLRLPLPRMESLGAEV